MAGLNNLLSDTQKTTTTLPAWYDQAQKDIVTGAGTAAAAAPTLNNTVAKGAIDQLNDPNNYFNKAQDSLSSIASGAANPWIIDESGNVAPNTSTAMGGLFQAQRNELNQLMPEYTAPVEAGAIGSGNFGSLRGMTAVDKAKGDAFAKLNAAQLQAALTNQQTGSSAAANLGNVTNQGINTAMNVGIEQMNAPFRTVGNEASVLGTIQAPTTVESQKQLSPLGQVTALGNAVSGGISGANSLLTSLGVKGGLSGLFTGSGSGSGSGSGTLGPGTGALDEEGNLMPGYTQNADGTYSYSGDNIPDTSGNGGGGGLTDQSLVDQESANTNYTQDQLDQYQNYYDNP